MALPKLKTPVYDLTLPSSGKKIKYKPFTLKEQRNLLTVTESLNAIVEKGEDASEEEQLKVRIEIVSAMKNLINSCVVTPKKFDVDKLPIFDIELIFLKLRAHSTQEVVELQFRLRECPQNVQDDGSLGPCQNEAIKVPVNLNEVQVEKNPKHDLNIPLTDEIGVTMRYPNFDMLLQIQQATSFEEQLDVIKYCIESIWNKTNSYKTDDAEPGEVDNFMNSLQTSHLEKLREFFETMPEVTHEVKLNCPHCEKCEDFTVRGTANFFV